MTGRRLARVGLRRDRTGDRVDIGRDGLAILALSCLVIAATAGLSLGALIGLVAARALTGGRDPGRVGAILVLGMALARGGAVGAEFRQRLDRAGGLATRAPAARVWVLGGVTRAGLPSEAEAGADELIRRHAVPPDRIETERRSRHTLENLRYCRDRLSAGMGAGGAPAALVTSGYHLARAGLLAWGVGLRVLPVRSDGGIRAVARLLGRAPWEAFLIHWYLTGRTYAQVTHNARMLARIS